MLVLASASPRRRELLAQAGFDFQVQSIPVAEERRPGENPGDLVKRLAREKAQAVFHACVGEMDRSHDPLLVLGADTAVVCDEHILGKPRDDADAARMLRLLAGRTHQVMTGVCILSRAGVDVAAETTQVTMNALTDDDIAHYIATGEPNDKAGAYAIQGRAGRWIPRIAGCYFNVVGLPIARVSAMLRTAESKLKAKN
jgi:septum formation protein